MNKMKVTLFVLTTFWLLFVSGVSYGRYAAIMIDAGNGNVLHEVDATQPWYPASLTKVMTLYMTFEALNSGQLNLYDSLTASYHASRQPTSKLGLRNGERLTVEEAILAVITRSANDAAVVLAEHLGGTEENFAAMMTQKARSLGMDNTQFRNATGLPNQAQVTTSRDMAMLAWKIQRQFPEYYPYFSSHSFYYKGRELRGINKFTAHYPGAEGMKTGYTCGSGFNLIGTAHQNGRQLIGVVLGGMTSAERYQLMMDMMDNGFSNRYSTGSQKNIHTMPSSGFGGEPPYQLDCGKGAKSHSASSAKHTGSGSKLRSKKTVIAKKKKIASKRHLAARNKSVGKTHKVASRSKATGKTRKVAAHRSKSSDKAQKVAARGKSTKSTGTAKTIAVAKATKSVKRTKSQKSLSEAKQTAKKNRSKKLATSSGNKPTSSIKTASSKGYHHPG